MAELSLPRVLFFVEGYTDIRFVVGLSEVCDLTMAVPARAYEESGLKERVAASGARLQVREIAGGRASFQLRSFAFLWNAIRDFDVVFSQEMLRGSLNATLVGALRGVPVVTSMALPPVEYFRCRRERGQIGAAGAWLGEVVIRSLLVITGRLRPRVSRSDRIFANWAAGTGHGPNGGPTPGGPEGVQTRIPRSLGPRKNGLP